MKDKSIPALKAAVWVNLEDMDNLILSTANICLQTTGEIKKETLAYQPFVDAGFIKDEKLIVPKDIILDCVSGIINKRINEGEFN